MKTAIVAVLLATVSFSSANADCLIDSKCSPQKYGQTRTSNTNSSVTVESYSSWYVYRGDPACAGLPRLEYQLNRQGRNGNKLMTITQILDYWCEHPTPDKLTEGIRDSELMALASMAIILLGKRAHARGRNDVERACAEFALFMNKERAGENHD
jgi:hypothetical protein